MARIAGFFAALVALCTPALVFAQNEYEPVTGAAAAQTRTDPNPYLVAAYGFIWVVVLLYVVGVARGLARARAEVAELRRRVDGAA